jgi:hypothetical protein
LLIASATIRNAETNGMSSVKDPAQRGEGLGSPVELVVVTWREFYKWLDRLTAEVKAAEDKLLGRVPDVKAAEDKLLGRVPDDRLIAELRRRGINYR